MYLTNSSGGFSRYDLLTLCMLTISGQPAERNVYVLSLQFLDLFFQFLIYFLTYIYQNRCILSYCLLGNLSVKLFHDII